MLINKDRDQVRNCRAVQKCCETETPYLSALAATGGLFGIATFNDSGHDSHKLLPGRSAAFVAWYGNRTKQPSRSAMARDRNAPCIERSSVARSTSAIDLRKTLMASIAQKLRRPDCESGCHVAQRTRSSDTIALGFPVLWQVSLGPSQQLVAASRFYACPFAARAC